MPTGVTFRNSYSIGNGQVSEAMMASDECCHTLDCMHDRKAVVVTYDSHPNDSRITEAKGVQQALTSRCGTGGGNLPLVQELVCYDPGRRDRCPRRMDESCFTQQAAMGEGGGNLPLAQGRFCIDDQGGSIVHVNDKDIGCTIRATSHVPCVTEPCVVNDQGGSCIDVLGDTCCTLRAQTHGHEPIVNEPVCFQQNQRDEIRLTGNDGKSCGAVMAEPGMKNQNYMAEPIALAGNTIGREKMNGGNGDGFETDGAMYTQTTMDIHAVCVPGDGGPGDGIRAVSVVRRLYPVECERLMGFPDGHTRIPWKGKPEEECPDGHRYKACGNSMCVNCIEWLGIRIEESERSHGMA